MISTLIRNFRGQLSRAPQLGWPISIGALVRTTTPRTIELADAATLVASIEHGQGWQRQRGCPTVPKILSVGRDKTAITARQNYLE
ncbi:MAG: hypothetical protein ABWY63_05600 [Hyphomicrobiaceae bacterium]